MRFLPTIVSLAPRLTFVGATLKIAGTGRRERQEAALDEDRLPGRAQHHAQPGLRGHLIRPPGHDRHRIRDLRLRPGGHPDQRQVRRVDDVVGEVDEPRVDLAERDLRDDVRIVGLLADDVRLDGRARPIWLSTCTV